MRHPVEAQDLVSLHPTMMRTLCILGGIAPPSTIDHNAKFVMDPRWGDDARCAADRWRPGRTRDALVWTLTRIAGRVHRPR